MIVPKRWKEQAERRMVVPKRWKEQAERRMVVPQSDGKEAK
ncbi:hypothetical protein ACFTQ7_09330 [Lysinibacillus sp. NPDC056959]